MFDSNLHLIKVPESECKKPLYIRDYLAEKYRTLTIEEYTNRLIELKRCLTINGFSGGMLYLLNECLYNRKSLFKVDLPDGIIKGCLVNPVKSKEDIISELNFLVDNGFFYVKILPYEQLIYKEYYNSVYTLAIEMIKRDMKLAVCCTYGSSYIYDINGVEIVAYLIDKGIDIPINMVHGGGPRVLDVLSLMTECDNLYMDLSFSLSYWEGSSVLQDYAFTINKLNGDRISYGSDYPYISMEKSLCAFQSFCYDYKIKYEKKILEQGAFYK